MDDEDEFESEPSKVGYGCPPIHSRWQRGQSGNPNGRPRHSRNRRNIVHRLALEERGYKEGDRLGRDTTLNLVLRAIRNSVANANPVGLKLCEMLLGHDQEPVSLVPKGVLITGEKLTVEEWIERYGHPD